jgi:hypothetical protein
VSLPPRYELERYKKDCPLSNTSSLLFPGILSKDAIPLAIRFLEQEQIPLDRARRRLELLTQPSRGNYLLLHENFQNLTQANETCAGIIRNDQLPSRCSNLKRVTYSLLKWVIQAEDFL